MTSQFFRIQHGRENKALDDGRTPVSMDTTMTGGAASPDLPVSNASSKEVSPAISLNGSKQLKMFVNPAPSPNNSRTNVVVCKAEAIAEAVAEKSVLPNVAAGVKPQTESNFGKSKPFKYNQTPAARSKPYPIKPWLVFIDFAKPWGDTSVPYLR